MLINPASLGHIEYQTKTLQNWTSNHLVLQWFLMMRASRFSLAVLGDDEETLRWARQSLLDFQQSGDRMCSASRMVQRIQKETQASMALMLSLIGLLQNHAIQDLLSSCFLEAGSLPALSLTKGTPWTHELKKSQTIIRGSLWLRTLGDR